MNFHALWIWTALGIIGLLAEVTMIARGTHPTATRDMARAVWDRNPTVLILGTVMIPLLLGPIQLSILLYTNRKDLPLLWWAIFGGSMPPPPPPPPPPLK